MIELPDAYVIPGSEPAAVDLAAADEDVALDRTVDDDEEGWGLLGADDKLTEPIADALVDEEVLVTASEVVEAKLDVKDNEWLDTDKDGASCSPVNRMAPSITWVDTVGRATDVLR